MIRKVSTLLVALTIMALITACGAAQTATPVTSTNTALVSATGTETGTPEATSEIPVTGETATPSMGVQTPTPMGQKIETQAQWEATALAIAQAAGFTTFDSEVYQLPANTSWDSTLAYYQSQAAAAGWGDAPTQTNEIAGGHSAVWSVTIDGVTNYFVVAQLDSAEGSFTLNLFGH